jgi:hypothetical protein
VETERYLGDGVYASFDGYQIWLDTRGESPVSRIALEPAVYWALIKYVGDLRRDAEAGCSGNTPGSTEGG